MQTLLAPWFASRLSLFFAALFLVYGVHVSYFPVWLNAQGLSAAEIGILTALPIFIRVGFTPLIGSFADTHDSHRTMIIGLSVGAIALVLLTMLGTSFWPLLLTSVPFSIAIGSMMPLTETIAVSGVRSAGLDYGRMRLWGSAAFLIATLAAGSLTDHFGPSVVILVLLVATVSTTVASGFLPERLKFADDTHHRELNTKPTERRLTHRLLTQSRFAIFLLAVGTIICSHAAFYTFGALHLAKQGVSGEAFGLLWAVSLVAEISLLAFSSRLLGRFGPVELIILAGLAGIVRWGVMSLDPPFGVVFVLQLLHGATYGAAHLGAILFISRAVPGRGASTAQSLYSAIGNGLFTGLATLLAGRLYPELGGGTFLSMAGLCGVGVAAALWLRLAWDGQPLLETVRLNPKAQPTLA